MTRSRIEVGQGLVALVGITLGVIPLVQKLLTGSTGSVWQWVLDEQGAAAAVAAAAVVVATLAIVVVLERGRRG